MKANLKTQKTKYPGIPTTADGSSTVVWVDTHITQAACAYPITPSTNMGQGYEAAVSNGKTNLWGEPLSFLELESEHSSASSCEGFALAGGRVSNFTCGQGLVLMKEVLFTISGKRLPVVFHIGARALTSQSLNIHGGHDDVMAVADVGWGILFAKNVQETADLALICRRVAEDTHTPFMNVQDGFLTTHTIESVLLPEPELMKEFMGDPKEKLFNFMNPDNPLMTGVVQNQDSYMKGKVAQRFFYDKVPGALKHAMEEFETLTGRKYDLVEPYCLEDADTAIIGMGTAMETVMATVDFLRKTTKLKVGALNITSFRPFPSKEIILALKNVKSISVIEKVDVPLMQSNPLTCEVKAAFADSGLKIPTIYSGVYGLGGRDVRPADFMATFHMMKEGTRKNRFFALGIEYKDTLQREKEVDIRPENTFSMRGHSVGGFGSVTTNKVMATLVSDLFGLYVQAFPKYGSEKKGLPTNYFLTISPQKVRTHCELEHVEFVALNDINAFNLGNPLSGLSKDGMVFIQTDKKDPKEVWKSIPDWAQTTIREQGIHVLALDTVHIAKEISSRQDLIQRMQGIVLLGIFLKSTPFAKHKKMSEGDLFKGVEESLRKYFGKRGENVIADNLKCVKRGYEEVFEVTYNG